MANYFPDLVISEVNYDFSHLDPFIMMVKSDMAKKELKVHVRFTNHCFTRGYEAFSHPEGEPIIPDHSGNERTFCPIRGSKPEPPKIPSADQRGLSRARSMG